MKPFLFTDLAGIIGADVLNTGSEGVCTSISIDSRTIAPGELFWAVKGENFDGNHFASDAARNGASGVVISEKPGAVLPGDCWCLLVPNSLKALQTWAQHYREQLAIPIIGITGTVGKTTVKDMIASVLGRKFKVGCTAGNLNGQIGVPLTLFNFTDSTEIGVVEMGISIPGEMNRLVRMVQPETAVLTHISAVHLEFFETMDQLFEEKTAIFDTGYGLKNAITRLNKQWKDRLIDKLEIPYLFYGTEHDSDYYLTQFLDKGLGGSRFTVTTPSENVEVHLSLTGKHNAVNSLPAIICGLLYGVPMENILEALRSMEPLSMRMAVKQIGWVTVLNDAYNASPESMKAALTTLAHFPGRRKIAVLGDMLELGDFEEKAHKDLANDIMSNSVDILITVGERMLLTADEALHLGFPHEKLISVADAESAADLITFLTEEGDLILLKGSRRLKLETIEKKISQILRE